MGERVTRRVTMELLSDTILGSGLSIPGGEDIAVCKYDAGFPYMKGSTLKGLLRESLRQQGGFGCHLRCVRLGGNSR